MKTVFFPKNEQNDIQKRISNGKHVFSVRVSKELDKFQQGEIYTTKWGSKLKVYDVKKINSIKEYAFYEYLTTEQQTFLKTFHKLDIIEFEPIKSTKK